MGLERAIAEVARRAAAPLPAGERGAEVLEAVRGLVPFACGALSLWDPAAGTYRTLANAGYAPALLDAIRGEGFRAELREFGLLDGPRTLRMRDLPCAPAAVRTIAEVVFPAGLREGLTVSLFAPDGRHVGLLNLNTESERHPTDDARAAVAMLAGVLGQGIDARAHVRAREGAAGDAAALATDGRVLPLAAGAAGVPEGALAVARRLLAAGTLPARFLWPAAGGPGWHRVRVTTCREEDLPGYAAVVVAGAPGPARGLTPRELEVLTLLARGWPNARIAERLVVTRRTVATHVERVLGKLGARSRADAAALAVAAGLLVAAAGEDPPAWPAH